jgi:transcriptional regulator with XRE-family HTH domain
MLESAALSKLPRAETHLLSIAERLKATRKANGLSQAHWCRLVGIEPPAWNNYEKGFRRISIDQALKVCAASGVTLDWIYRGLASGLPIQLAIALRRSIDKEHRNSR